MNQSVSSLGNAVRATRKRRNLSQEALAERIGVCKRTIIDIEKNTGNPKFELLCLLVKELDLPLYKIFYPEAEDDKDERNWLSMELGKCSEQEMQVLVSMVRNMRKK